MWTFPAELRRIIWSGSWVPIIVARLNLPAAHIVQVLNYAAGAGDTLTINGRTLTEGVDFTATGSNATTAANIANAWNNNATAAVTADCRALREGTNVLFIRLSSLTTAITISTSDATAWVEHVQRFATQIYYSNMCGRIPPGMLEIAGSSDPLVHYDPTLSSIGPLDWSLDAIERKTTSPKIEISIGTLNDEISGPLSSDSIVVRDRGDLRQIARRYGLRRRRIDLFLGADELASFATDYAQIGVAYIDDIRGGPGEVKIIASDAMRDAWRDRQIRGRWVAWHPLQVIQDILTDAGAVGFNMASLDPATDTYRSHFVVSRYDDQKVLMTNAGVEEAEQAGELVDELLTIMGGCLRPSSTGEYSYAAFDYTASPVITFDAWDDVDGETSQSTGLGNPISSCTVSFARSDGGKTVEVSETDLMGFFEQGIVSDQAIRTDWCNGVGETSANTDTGAISGVSRWLHDSAHGAGPNAVIIYQDTRSFPVVWAGRQGFCGARYTQSGGGAPALATGCTMGGSTGRYCIVRIRNGRTGLGPNRSDGLDETEYFLIDSWTLHDYVPDHTTITPAAPSGSFVPNTIGLSAHITTQAHSTVLPNGRTIAQWFGTTERLAEGGGANPTGRGALGGSAPAQWGSPDRFRPAWIDDCTIPVYLAKEVVRRFGRGAPVLNIKTSLQYLAVEIGDFVQFGRDDLAIGYLWANSASGIVYEVTGKSVEFFSSPGIEWELTYVRNDNEGSVPFGFTYPDPPTLTLATSQISIISEAVTDGGVIVTDGGMGVYSAG